VVLRHLARNHWQSAYHHHVTVDAATASANPPDRDLDPAAWLERLERRDRLQDAMRHLSFEQREVLSLRFGQELSVDETAAVVGVPAGTVKSRVFTALRRLRDQLDQLGARADDTLGDHQHG
jgi:RNA polymerase sigma-70 factor (ECF subfamily)